MAPSSESKRLYCPSKESDESDCFVESCREVDGKKTCETSGPIELKERYLRVEQEEKQAHLREAEALAPACGRGDAKACTDQWRHLREARDEKQSKEVYGKLCRMPKVECRSRKVKDDADRKNFGPGQLLYQSEAYPALEIEKLMQGMTMPDSMKSPFQDRAGRTDEIILRP